MKARIVILPIIFAMSFVFLPVVHAEPSVNIIMEKTTYSYCEKLFFIIEVSEITGESAIIHIRDEAGKESSAIPIQILNLQNPVPPLIAFEAEIFLLGKYFIDVEYSGAEFTSEFNLIESDNICIPGVIKQFLIEWLNNKMSDGYLIDAFQKYVDIELIDIPFEINDENILKIDIPDWTKNVGYWWVQGVISDKDFAQVINYLIDKNIISPAIGIENEI
ncbi:MAG: hypothetical protein HRO68_07270 [Nitrosopumilus sp.]|nr:hypothetical protein [Nitrosopumilus sp.]